jgi:hypothetical protein
MRGLIFRIFLPGGNPDGILFPAAATATPPARKGGRFVLGSRGEPVCSPGTTTLFLFLKHKGQSKNKKNTNVSI